MELDREQYGSNPFQRTPEWYEERKGHLTASIAADALSTLKSGGMTKASESTLWDTVAERVTGEVTYRYNTLDMQWGQEHEGQALIAYQKKTGKMVEMVSFIRHPDIPWLGASPDGLVDRDGLVEVKCPKSKTHLKRIHDGVVPEEYKIQMIVQLLCTGRKWCDFVSYDPRCVGYELFIVRFEPTEEEKQEVLDKCIAFLKKVDETMHQLEINQTNLIKLENPNE